MKKPILCSQCNKPALFLVGEEGSQVPMCLDCRLKFVQMLQIQNQMHERQINYASDYMSFVAGVPLSGPRFHETPIIQTGGITLNNININDSVIGVVNTGQIESIDMAVSNLQSNEKDELAGAIKLLSESVLNSNELNIEIKRDLIELISALSTEATAPEQQSRKSIMTALVTQIGSMLTNTGQLIDLWEKIKPIFSILTGG